jgi:hypothetical protein
MTGSDERRAELRKLTSLGLLRRREGRSIRDLRDGETIAVSDLLAVTPLGEQWARRLAELDAQKRESD